MKNIFEKYLEHKKITIPVTAGIVAVLVAGGIFISLHKSAADETPAVAKKVEKEVTTPTTISYDKKGTYSDKATFVAGEITADGVTVENATFDTLTITEAVGDGSANLNNVTVKKSLIINGGGTHSVYLNGGTYAEVISNDYDCHIVVSEDCSVKTLTAPSSALIEVNGSVKTANIVPSSYEGEITWECGFKTGKKANVEKLNIAEEVKAEVTVEDTTGAVKEQKALSKAETNKVQSSAQQTTHTVQQSTANGNGGNTSASTNGNNGSSQGANNSSAQNNSNGNNSNGNSSSGNGSNGSTPPNIINGDDNLPTQKCPTCGLEKKGYGNVFLDHDCPNAKDYYGNIVPKNSRYVVAVGGYGTKKYSDGTYEVTEEGRNALRQSYESEVMIYQGAGLPLEGRVASLDAWVIANSGI